MFRFITFIESVLDKIEKAKRITKTLSSFQKHFKAFLEDFRTIWDVVDTTKEKVQDKPKQEKTTGLLNFRIPKKKVEEIDVKEDSEVIENNNDTSVKEDKQ